MIALTCRLVVATVLFAASMTKLVDRKEGAASLEAFGLPLAVAQPLAIGLPVVEFLVAVALLPASTARIGAMGAAVLFAAFTIVVATTLARGLRPDCGCFGNLHRAPIGPGTLGRNAALLGVSLVPLASGSGGPSAVSWIEGLNRAEALGLAALVVTVLFGLGNGAFALGLLRQNGRLWQRIAEIEHGVPPQSAAIGEPVPELNLYSPLGKAVELEELIDPEAGLLLLFVDQSCGACKNVVEEAARAIEVGAPIAVISRTPVDAGAPYYLIEELEGMRAAGVKGFPGAVRVDAQGAIASAAGHGPELVGKMIREVRPMPMLVDLGGRP